MCCIPETTWINYSQLIGGAITSVVGGLIGFLSARRIAMFGARQQAASNLRASFTLQLAYLKSLRSTEGSNGGVEETRDYLYAALVQSQAAELAKFRFFVKSENLEAYDKTCEEYEHHLYPGFTVDVKGQSPQEYFITQIRDLLDFTK